MLKLETNAHLQLVWLSKEARDKWENVISQISAEVQRLEIESVKKDHRLAAWQTIPTSKLSEFTMNNYENNDLYTYPIKNVGQWNGFSHKTVPVKNGEPTNTYCVLTKDMNIAIDFKNAHFAGNHIKQGEYLGFPDCCTNFFIENWSKSIIDPISEMKDIENPHPYSNPLLRYLGVRSGFHIPCSFNCEKTIKIGEQRVKLGDEVLMKIMTRLLSMPMSWDNYHGIAIIRTPIFHIIVQSNPVKERKFIKIPGNFIPKEAVKGNIYPNTEV